MSNVKLVDVRGAIGKGVPPGGLGLGIDVRISGTFGSYRLGGRFLGWDLGRAGLFAGTQRREASTQCEGAIALKCCRLVVHTSAKLYCAYFRSIRAIRGIYHKSPLGPSINIARGRRAQPTAKKATRSVSCRAPCAHASRVHLGSSGRLDHSSLPANHAIRWRTMVVNPLAEAKWSCGFC